MMRFQTYSLVLLRLALGWLFFYAGITKILNPEWSAAGYLKGAKTFSGLYQWLSGPSALPVINFLNEWGLTLIGISLILGVGVRASSYAGALLMALYYFPVLEFPFIGTHSYIVDEHIIYIISFWVLGVFRAGRMFGIDARTGSILPERFRNLFG